MQKKFGRPRLPKGKSKEVLFAFKISSEESKRIEEDIKDSGLGKGDWARNQLIQHAREIWVICDRWCAADLRGKSVQFSFKTKDRTGFYEGVGTFWITEHREKIRLSIAIHAAPPLGRLARLVLNQQLADAIERHPDASVADFRCLATVGTLRCHG